MSDMEKEAFRQIGINLINEYRQQGGLPPIDWLEITTPKVRAFIRSIQLHEKTKKELADCKQELSDFRQEVSDIAEAHFKHAFTVQEMHLSGYKVTVGFEKQKDATAWFDQLLSLPKFIIPAPKPDPLVEAMHDCGVDRFESWADQLRAALDARGLEIREKNDGVA